MSLNLRRGGWRRSSPRRSTSTRSSCGRRSKRRSRRTSSSAILPMPCRTLLAPADGRSSAALTEDEIRKLLAAAAGTRFDRPIRFTLATGVREGEMLALRWSDIDLKGRVIKLRGTKSAKSRRSIEISQLVVELLEGHRKAQNEVRLKLGPTWPENGLVFPSTVGTPWARRAFYRDYKTFLGRARNRSTRTRSPGTRSATPRPASGFATAQTCSRCPAASATPPPRSRWTRTRTC